MSVRFFVRHDVTDFAAWRKAHNDFDEKRRKMGVTRQAVYRSIDDANDVTVTHDFASAEKGFVTLVGLSAVIWGRKRSR